MYATLGLAAVHGLREILGDEGALTKLAGHYRSMLQLALAASHARWNDAWTLEEVDAGLYQNLERPVDKALRPLLVYALRRLHGREPLPGGPAWVYGISST